MWVPIISRHNETRSHVTEERKLPCECSTSLGQLCGGNSVTFRLTHHHRHRHYHKSSHGKHGSGHGLESCGWRHRVHDSRAVVPAAKPLKISNRQHRVVATTHATRHVASRLRSAHSPRFLVHCVPAHAHDRPPAWSAPRQRRVATPQNSVSSVDPRATRPLHAVVPHALVLVPWLVKLVWARNVPPTRARATAASVTARYKAELKAADTRTDVDVVVVDFVVPVVVALEPFVKVKDVVTNVKVAASVISVDTCEARARAHTQQAFRTMSETKSIPRAKRWRRVQKTETNPMQLRSPASHARARMSKTYSHFSVCSKPTLCNPTGLC
jgi:hypothetical protein